MNKSEKHIYNKIKEYENIVIVRHLNSDMDALGSQFALKEWITLNFPNKHVYCLGENHQKYTKNFIPKSDSFDVEEKFLGICVDVNSLARIDGNEEFSKADYKICIDHHHYQENGEFDYVYIDDKIIACCQIIAELLFDFKKKMNTQVCKYLYAGIYSDSGRLFYPGTDSETLDMASKLLKVGKFEPYKEVHLLVGLDSLKDLKITSYLCSKLVTDDNGFAYFINSIEDLNVLQTTPSGANEQISSFNKLEEINIMLAASECEDHTYRCSIRSKTIPINEIASKYGGGGHKFASGVKGIDRETLEKMIEDLQNLVR